MARSDTALLENRRTRGVLPRLALCGLAFAMLSGASAKCTLTVDVENLRSQKGMLLMCLTTQQKYFPECDRDPDAVHVSVAARDASARFEDLPSGSYALSILHDENANAQLDKFAGIPREGIGFSGNPNFSFGPPKFRQVRFNADAGAISQTVRIKYFL